MLFRGLMVGAASGKLGSLVASHNKGGQYMRARTTPVGRTPSPEQMAVRNGVSSLSAAWSNDLTQIQRDGWNLYALNVPSTNAMGDSIQLSGQNWYIASNTPRLQAGLDRVDDAPTTYNRGTPPTSSAVTAMSATRGTLTLNSDASTLTLAGTLLLYAGRPFSPGRGKYFGSFRLAESTDLTTGAARIGFDLPFPSGAVPDRLDVRYTISYDDGRISAETRVSFP